MNGGENRAQKLAWELMAIIPPLLAFPLAVDIIVLPLYMLEIIPKEVLYEMYGYLLTHHLDDLPCASTILRIIVVPIFFYVTKKLWHKTSVKIAFLLGAVEAFDRITILVEYFDK
ncbi:hypothetical protein [Persephonella sp.]